MLLQYCNSITWKPGPSDISGRMTIKKFLKIDGTVVCLSFTVNMARFGTQMHRCRIYLVFFFYLQNEMLCTKHIIVFSLWNSFPIVLFGIVSLRLVWVLYLTRQKYRRRVPSGEDNSRILVTKFYSRSSTFF